MYPTSLSAQTPHCAVIVHHTALWHRVWLWPVYLIMITMLATLSPRTYADTRTAIKHDTVQPSQNAGQNTAFYQLLQKTDTVFHKPVDNGAFSLLTNNLPELTNNHPDLVFDEDLAFNYLWMKQYQPHYRHKEGGAAAGKLIRMGVKAFYKSYAGSTQNLSDDEIAGPLSTMGYRIRFSSDKIKLGLEYSF